MLEPPKFESISSIKPYYSRDRNIHRKSVVPEIKIELDQMLNDAYSELRLQPKKNLILGQKKDIYVLDNKVLREYINGIYYQYPINDPLPQRPIFSEQNALKPNINIRSKSQCNSMSQHNMIDYETPKKNAEFSKQTKNTMKIKHSNKNKQKKIAKGKYAIDSLKRNLKLQLNSNAQKSDLYEQYNGKDHNLRFQAMKVSTDLQSEQEQRKFPIMKNGPKRLKVRLSKNSNTHAKQSSNRSLSVKSISLESSVQHSQYQSEIGKGPHKYCIYCEKEIYSSKQIKRYNPQQHYEKCAKFINFMKIFFPKNPPISAVHKLLEQKLDSLSRNLLYESSNFSQQANILESAIKKYLQKDTDERIIENNENNTPIKSLKLLTNSKRDISDKKNINHISLLVEQSRMMQCYKQIEKYEYFREINKFLNGRMLYSSQERCYKLQNYLGYAFPE